MVSKEIVIDINNIKNVPDDNYFDDIKFKIRYFISNNMKMIVFIFLILIIGGIVTSISLTSNTKSFPCIGYGYDTLASSVSIACLQYIWVVTGCTKSKPPIPNDYSGYYLRSPSGLTTVHCNNNINCGVGNYNAMVTQLQVCNLNYN